MKPQELEEVVAKLLKSFNPKTTIIATGATQQGIGTIYPVAKNLNFQTLGIVSTLAKPNEISPSVDFVVYVEDNEWGGYLSNSKQLSPVSDVIVKCSHVAIMCGGGEIAKIEADSMRGLGKDVIYLPMKSRL